MLCHSTHVGFAKSISLKLLMYCVFAGFQWDYVFDWTILKYQQTKNHAVARPGQARPDAAPAAQADPADTDKGDRSGFARASRGDSGRRFVSWCIHGCIAPLRVHVRGVQCQKLHHSSAHALLEHVRSCKYMEAKPQCQKRLLMCSCLQM